MIFKLGRLLTLVIALCAAVTPAHAKEDPGQPSFNTVLAELSQEPGYTINFNNVSVLEVVKYLSEVAKLNFVYKEEELNFNVTITSEAEASLVDVMTAFMQVLRVHNLELIEDGRTILIHTNPEIKGLATVISEASPLEGDQIPPIVTRVFYIEKGNPNHIASILKPMLSKGAVVEVSSTTRHLIVTDFVGTIEKIGNLLLTLDAPLKAMEVATFKARYNKPSTLMPLLEQVITPLAGGNPFIVVPQPETNSLYLISTPYLIKEAMDILDHLDSPPTVMKKAKFTGENIFIYQIQHQDPAILMKEIRNVSDEMQNSSEHPSELIHALNSARYIQQSHAIVFTGDATALGEIKTIMTDLDNARNVQIAQGQVSDFYIYQVANATEDQIVSALEHLVTRLQKSEHPDESLIETIDSMKWIGETHSIVFTGPKTSIDRLKEILPTLDIAPAKSPHSIPPSDSFYIYHPKSHSGEEVVDNIDELADKLEDSGLEEPAVLQALRSAKYVPSSNTVVFTGDPEALSQVESLVANIETKTSVASFQLRYISSRTAIHELKKLAEGLPENSPVRDCIDSIQYTKSSRTLYLSGTPEATERVEEMLTEFDKPTAVIPYHLKFITAKEALGELNRVIDGLPKHAPLSEVVDNIRTSKSNKILYISGPPDVTQRVTDMLDEFDTSHAVASESSSFFMYKPEYATPEELKETLIDVADDLKASGLTNQDVLQTILTTRVVETSNSLLFTGPPDAITQIKELLPSIDNSSMSRPVKHIGETTFLIYKIKYVTGPQLMQSIKSVLHDLKATGSPNKNLIKTIDNMRYIPETDSIVFTGTKDALDRAHALAEKFDNEAYSRSSRQTPQGYLVYKPKYLSGDELIHVLRDFEENLVASGVDDQPLVDAIQNAKWMPKTSSIMITGQTAATEKVKELLERFDIPGAETKPQTAIETIDDTSFLIYKLQFHQGSEIQQALTNIAQDLKRSTKGKQNNLVEAIDSVQWIQVTNSLIASGNAGTLDKLKGLIQGIDVQLRQVFIEILIIETTTNNTLNFGLRWGGQGKWRNKLGFGGQNNPVTSSDSYNDFSKNLQGITASNTPTGQDIPFATGGDLGIIGDIILHKGKSYFALGSLMNALQTDGDNTVVLNQKIITQDNQLSTIFVGSNVPYTGSVVTTTQNAGTQTNANLEYRDIGVSLNITPTIGSGDLITLDIDEKITEEENQGAGDSSNNVSTNQVNGITTSKTETQTKVTLPDRHFLAISGMIRNTTDRLKVGFPCLGSLPMIGALFSQNDSLKEKRNVIIFIRPTIVNSFEQYTEITNRQEDIFREQADAEDFDAGIELVKTPDDE